MNTEPVFSTFRMLNHILRPSRFAAEQRFSELAQVYCVVEI